jgi:hypothetical protein
MDSYRYEDFDEYRMTRSFERDGGLEVRLCKEKAQVFDYLLSRYSNKKPSEMLVLDGMYLFSGFFMNLRQVYRLRFAYPKLGCFDRVFESAKPIDFRYNEVNEEVIYKFKTGQFDGASL